MPRHVCQAIPVRWRPAPENGQSCSPARDALTRDWRRLIRLAARLWRSRTVRAELADFAARLATLEAQQAALMLAIVVAFGQAGRAVPAELEDAVAAMDANVIPLSPRRPGRRSRLT